MKTKKENIIVAHPYEILRLCQDELAKTKTALNKESFYRVFMWEYYSLLSYAKECVDPLVYMANPRIAGNQIIIEFSVSDKSKPRKDECNWHGQNTSQWKYAGGIVVDRLTGKVSSHH